MSKRIHNLYSAVTVPVLLIKHGIALLCANFALTKKASGLYRFSKTFLVASLLLCFIAGNSLAATYNWKGGSSGNSWNATTNWVTGIVPGPNDVAQIGVSTTFATANSPIVTASTFCNNIIIGNNGASAGSSGNTMNLTVNSGVTLTITMNSTLFTNTALSVDGSTPVTITVNGTLTAASPATVGDFAILGNNIVSSLIVTTTLAGTGTISFHNFFACASTSPNIPANNFVGITKLVCTVNQLTINGNLAMNAAGNILGTSTGICYPWVSLDAGTLTITNSVTFLTSLSPKKLSSTTIGGVTFNGFGQFTANSTGDPVNTLELQGSAPFFNPGSYNGFYVWLTNGGTNGTVLYDAPSGTQRIYVANEPNNSGTPLGSIAPGAYINSNTTYPAYYNLALSGASTKTVDANSTFGTSTQGLTVGGTLTTSGGAVNLNTNSPTVIVGGGWTNSTTVTQGSGATGTIKVGGAFSNTGTFTTSTPAVTFNGGTGTAALPDYDNEGTFTTAAGSNIFFGGANPFLKDGSTGTTFYKVTFNGSGTATMVAGTGNFKLANVGILNMTSPAKLVAGITTAGGAAYLTLISDATGTATIGQITGSSTITGNVNVQRFMTGANVAYRGYRLLSSPVYTGTSAGQNSYDFIALQQTTPITGGGVTGAYPGGAPTGTFDASPTGNPSVFYYYEPNIDPPDKTIPHSDYKGLATINEKLLVGNGFLFYFRGDRSMNDNNNALPKTATLAVPQNTTLNFKGTLNQGNINVYVPTDVIATNSGTYVTPAGAGNVSTSLSNTNNSSTRDGLHLIGNPYASAIDLDAVTVSNPYNAYIFILNNTGVFGVYQKGSASVYPPALLNNGVGRYILSGQGFFVRANNTGPATTVSFAETNKVTSVATTATPVSFASQPASANLRPQELHVTLSLDSLNANEAVMQFGKAKNRYDDREDAYYISGLSQTTFMASYSSDNKPCLFNVMGSLDSIKTIPLYAEGQTTGRYSMTFNGAASIDARYKLFLKDNLLKDSLDLSANSTYTFNIDRGNTKTYGDKRFTLVVQATHIQDHYQLTSLNATKNNNSISLVWKTVNEGNYVGFNVLRSIDGGKTFAAIGSVQANGSGFYDYTDTNPALGGTNQYKIEQNIDKVTALSSVVTVSYLTLNANTNKLQIYPNPVAATIKVAVQPEANGGSLVIRIYSVRGELMMSNTFTGNNSLSMDVSKLMQGTYVIKVNDNKKNYGSATFTKL